MGRNARSLRQIAVGRSGDRDDEDSQSALTEARTFLEDLLHLSAVPPKLVFKDTHAAGISDATLKRASRELGVEKRKDGLKGPWLWSLPPTLLKTQKLLKKKM